MTEPSYKEIALNNARVIEKQAKIIEELKAEIKNMKPSWEEAPKWAKYRATDFDRQLWYYANKPELDTCSWRDPKEGREDISILKNWTESLEARP